MGSGALAKGDVWTKKKTDTPLLFLTSFIKVGKSVFSLIRLGVEYVWIQFIQVYDAQCTRFQIAKTPCYSLKAQTQCSNSSSNNT